MPLLELCSYDCGYMFVCMCEHESCQQCQCVPNVTTPGRLCISECVVVGGGGGDWVCQYKSVSVRVCVCVCVRESVCVCV